MKGYATIGTSGKSNNNNQLVLAQAKNSNQHGLDASCKQKQQSPVHQKQCLAIAEDKA